MDDAPRVAYHLEPLLPSGRVNGGLLTGTRVLAVGDTVNLPDRPDGESRPGKGYIYLVTAVRIVDGKTWVTAEYHFPHPEMDESVEPYRGRDL